MPLHMSTWAIMKNIVAKNGFSGLFTGKNICFTKSLSKIITFTFKSILPKLTIQQEIVESNSHL